MKTNNEFKYYVSENYLISYSIEKNIYKIENSIYPKPILQEEIFKKISKTKISKDKFNELLNNYFKNVNCRWTYKNEKFKKLPNFKSENNIYDWDIIKDIPEHDLTDEKLGRGIIVYYHDEVYYFILDGNAFPRGMLVSINKEKRDFKIWTHIRNVAPIYNISLKKII